MNLFQDASSTGSIAAPASITVTTALGNTSAGNAALRVVLQDPTGNTWCVEAGQWASGHPIPISSFNTACWNGAGTNLTQGTAIQSISLQVPADLVLERPFSFCLTGVSVGTTVPADSIPGKACTSSAQCAGLSNAYCSAAGICTVHCSTHADCGCPAGTTNGDIASAKCGASCITLSSSTTSVNVCLRTCTGSGQCEGSEQCSSTDTGLYNICL